MTIAKAKSLNAAVKPLKPIGYIFWAYDRFPYVLGAAATKVEAGGLYSVPSYGPAARIKAEYVTEIADGQQLQVRLDTLESAYLAEVHELREKYRKKALVVAPFLKAFNPYRNYQLWR